VKDEGREAFIDFISKASESGAVIVYDPNFRKANAKDADALKRKIEQNIALADIVKGSDEDFVNVYRASDIESAWEKVQKTKKVPLIYTANKEGVYVKTPSFEKYYQVPAIQPVSTIGAGDTFSAGVIYKLYEAGIGKDDMNNISEQLWDKIIHTAIDFAQHVCMHYDNYLSAEYAEKH
jgi:fructokinase